MYENAGRGRAWASCRASELLTRGNSVGRPVRAPGLQNRVFAVGRVPRPGDLRACLKSRPTVGRGSCRAVRQGRTAAVVEARQEPRPTTTGVFIHTLRRLFVSACFAPLRFNSMVGDLIVIAALVLSAASDEPCPRSGVSAKRRHLEQPMKRAAVCRRAATPRFLAGKPVRKKQEASQTHPDQWPGSPLMLATCHFSHTWTKFVVLPWAQAGVQRKIPLVLIVAPAGATDPRLKVIGPSGSYAKLVSVN